MPNKYKYVVLQPNPKIYSEQYVYLMDQLKHMDGRPATVAELIYERIKLFKANKYKEKFEQPLFKANQAENRFKEPLLFKSLATGSALLQVQRNGIW